MFLADGGGKGISSTLIDSLDTLAVIGNIKGCSADFLIHHTSRHTSHVTRHTSHITHHTSHVTHHRFCCCCQPLHQPLRLRRFNPPRTSLKKQTLNPFAVDLNVSVFETIIRGVGGLLSAHMLLPLVMGNGSDVSHMSEALLKLAVDLATRCVRACVCACVRACICVCVNVLTLQQGCCLLSTPPLVYPTAPSTCCTVCQLERQRCRA